MAVALAVGVPAFVVPCLVLARDRAEPIRVDSADYYQFVSVRDETALAGADDADGARIQQEKRAAGATSQQWQLRPLTGGYCVLVNHDSGKVLGIRGYAATETDVEPQPDTGVATQQWQLRDVGGGKVKIVSRSGGLVLSVTEGTDRHAVVQATDRGGPDQRWTLAEAGTAEPPAPGVAIVAAGTLFAGTDGGRSFTARAANLGHFGAAGDRGIADGGELAHSTDGGARFSRLGSVRGAQAVGFGKAAPGEVTGIFRSTDGGAAWPRINDDQHPYGGGVSTGDPDGDGRVHVGTNGRGVLYAGPS